MSRIKPIEKLRFSSYQDAVAALNQAAHTDKINATRFAYYVPGNLPRINGDPYLLGDGVIDCSQNSCVSGNLNLSTGEVKVSRQPCVIID